MKGLLGKTTIDIKYQYFNVLPCNLRRSQSKIYEKNERKVSLLTRCQFEAGKQSGRPPQIEYVPGNQKLTAKCA